MKINAVFGTLLCLLVVLAINYDDQSLRTSQSWLTIRFNQPKPTNQPDILTLSQISDTFPQGGFPYSQIVNNKVHMIIKYDQASPEKPPVSPTDAGALHGSDDDWQPEVLS